MATSTSGRTLKAEVESSKGPRTPFALIIGRRVCQNKISCEFRAVVEESVNQIKKELDIGLHLPLRAKKGEAMNSRLSNQEPDGKAIQRSVCCNGEFDLLELEPPKSRAKALAIYFAAYSNVHEINHALYLSEGMGNYSSTSLKRKSKRGRDIVSGQTIKASMKPYRACGSTSYDSWNSWSKKSPNERIMGDRQAHPARIKGDLYHPDEKLTPPELFHPLDCIGFACFNKETENTITTWSRASTIIPAMIGHTIAVHNGKERLIKNKTKIGVPADGKPLPSTSIKPSFRKELDARLKGSLPKAKAKSAQLYSSMEELSVVVTHSLIDTIGISVLFPTLRRASPMNSAAG
ncbi:30S ribosomal protein S19 [Striga asiatica]|uniref:30S ribosomal protein S19 n=1 Tax=Striga asiatica TaxID=4170 RepID=A0A5A7P7E0_STRAF|nr:30S ribosomal protein S19 [Striga asiatica]